MKIYESEPGLKKSWDNVQKMVRVFTNNAELTGVSFKCCGVTNKTDWYDVLNGTLPSSCCSVGTDRCVDGWAEPCYQKARRWLLENIPSVLVFGLCIAVVQILALVFSLLMYCQILCAEKALD
ncbi:Tetraspanin-4 [Liparis tanakae]|uniref:Tetraspanin-4 n=1 Tax=Liparis tanakae TaxID=230148 RepID=A0A4Z2IXK5_9TELE|nr:Tetraspanin-4 [Liparis tanakae]